MTKVSSNFNGDILCLNFSVCAYVCLGVSNTVRSDVGLGVDSCVGSDVCSEVHSGVGIFSRFFIGVFLLHQV